MILIPDFEAGKNHFLLQKVNFPASDNYFTFQSINKYATEGELLLDTNRDKKGQFIKGLIPWNKGNTNCYSEDTLKKMSTRNWKKRSKDAWKKRSEAKKGQIPWNKGKKGVQAGENHPFYGRHHTADTIQKISASKTGVPSKCPIEKRAEIYRKIGEALRGKKLTDEQKKNMYKPHPNIQGKKHYKWRGGKHLRYARHSAQRRDKGFVMITEFNPYTEPVDYHHIHPDLPYVIPCPTRIHRMFLGSKNHYNLVNAFLGFHFEEL